MAEETAPQVEADAFQTTPTDEKRARLIQRARRGPKRRGEGLKVGQFTFRRRTAGEVDADRRAIMMLLGAAVPLPLLFVGVLVYDYVSHRPPAAPVPLVSLSPGHGETASHGETNVHEAAAPKGQEAHAGPAHSSPNQKPHAEPGHAPEQPAEDSPPHPPSDDHAGPAHAPEAHEGHAEPVSPGERLEGRAAPAANHSNGHPEAPAAAKGSSPGYGEAPPGKGPLVRAWAAMQGWLGRDGATPAMGVPQPSHSEAAYDEEHSAARLPVSPLPTPARAPAPIAGAERELEPGYVPRSRSEAIESVRAARKPEASAEPAWSARVVASVAGWFLASSRQGERGLAASGPASPVPVATPNPALLTRWAKQVSARLKIQLEPGGSGWYRYRTPDGLARVNLERMPDGGAQLQLVVDMGFLSSAPEVRQALPDPRRYPGGVQEAFLERFPGNLSFWLKQRPGFGLVDRFVATYMPPGPGTSPSARLDWWADMLRARVDEANRPRDAAAGQVWIPTFNVGARLGQSFLAGQEFTLQLYIPPEDSGL